MWLAGSELQLESLCEPSITHEAQNICPGHTPADSVVPVQLSGWRLTSLLLRSPRLGSDLGGYLVIALIGACFNTVLPLFVEDTFGWQQMGQRLIFRPLAAPHAFDPLVGKIIDHRRQSRRYFVGGAMILSVLVRRVADDIGKYYKLARTFSQEMALAGLDGVGFPEEHVEAGSHRPMFALLLLHCPRLASLHIHVPSQDPYLAAILRDAIVRRWEGQPPPKILVQAPVYIEKEQPFFRLPKLEDFQIVDAQFGREIGPLPQEDNVLTNLSIAFHASLVQHLWPTLRHTNKLTHLSLSLCDARGRMEADLGIHQDLWAALLPFKDQLEYLDLFEPEKDFERWSRDELFYNHRGNTYCCPLSTFTKLRHLAITPLLLLGHGCTHMAPTKFISHLPRKMEYFALYGHIPEWIHRHIHRYGDELCEIVRNVPAFPIKSIVIDAYFGVESKAYPFFCVNE
ncbi:hypothetical protein BJX62DRAFT_242203 [Aspergillus germanicus]